MKELDAVRLKLSPNKSPGSGGLTANFSSFFWKDIRTLLFKAIQECIQNNERMPTMKQGLITLIPKRGKDKRLLDNLRPIALLNVMYCSKVEI